MDGGIDMERYGLYCKTICEYFRNGGCRADVLCDMDHPPICEVLEWDALEEMAREGQNNGKVY